MQAEGEAGLAVREPLVRADRPLVAAGKGPDGASINVDGVERVN